ncbi:hypothetical protein V6N13_005024 [Hibiscus sabdariffa]|uniref:Uncharacterized protein n=1 Tax=Hibiscus sabdariffa TaxID=183260 RepID=A0ABR2C373_9ROSI
MTELEQSSGLDTCPDSLIFTPESNFSSASDAQSHDHDPLASQLSLDMKEDIKMRVVVDQIQKQTKLSQSQLSLQKNRQSERWTGSEALLKFPERLGAISLDLNNVSVSSPRLRTMNKSSIATWKSCDSPSLTPNYHHHLSARMQKGWNFECVPLQNNGTKRQGSVVAVLCSNNGKNLPSNCLCSPSMYIFDGGNTWNFLAGSPFSAGVISVNGLKIHSRNHYEGFSVRTEPCMARSVSVHGCSGGVSPPSLPS